MKLTTDDIEKLIQSGVIVQTGTEPTDTDGYEYDASYEYRGETYLVSLSHLADDSIERQAATQIYEAIQKETKQEGEKKER